MSVEIPCQQFSDLKVVVENNPPTQDDIAWIVIQAIDVNDACFRRSSGKSCPGNCAIPRVMRGDPVEIRAALDQASK